MNAVPTVADTRVPPFDAPGLGIAYFGNDWFAENRTSSHHMATRIAQHARVLYVDSPGMRPPGGSRRDLRRLVAKLAQAFRRPRQLQPGLWHCTVPQLPWPRLPGVAWLNRRFGAWAVRRALRGAGIERVLLWFVVPHPSFMLDAVPHELAVYHCIDDYAAHPGVHAAHIAACDAELTRRADHVFVAPPALLAAKAAANPSTSFAPHGVDTALFGAACLPATPVPAAAARLARPVVGYFGLIAAWTDLALIEWLARQRPQWQFLLVGHAAVDVRALAALPNVHLPGAQPYASLPGWAKAFDAAIIPYRLNRQVHNANPLKLREYLATGRPVVSVRTPEVERFAGVVHVADGREAFLQGLEDALRNDSPALRARRMEAVKHMDWDGRAAAVLDTVAQVFAQRRGGTP